MFQFVCRWSTQIAAIDCPLVFNYWLATECPFLVRCLGNHTVRCLNLTTFSCSGYRNTYVETPDYLHVGFGKILTQATTFSTAPYAQNEQKVMQKRGVHTLAAKRLLVLVG
jgi:hypothetical protein